MDAFNQLSAQYSFGEVALVLLLFVICVKQIGASIEWIVDKIRGYFKSDLIKDEKMKEGESIHKKLDELAEKVDALSIAVKNVSDQNGTLESKINDLDLKNSLINEQISKVEKQEKNIQEHLMGYTRAFIIDKYHYYCYQTRQIDDISLQGLEVCYLYYKSNGGNSFVDGLMERLRSLPRVNMENASIEEGGE